jgi:hypothetical protein
MALDNSTPVQSTPAPAAAPSDAPASSGVPASVPAGISGLSAPGSTVQDTLNAVSGPMQAQQDALKKEADIAGESTAPPPPGPHARLLAMVQGLALGADSFGKSIATHGREGGVEEVQQQLQAQQNQKIQAQQARDAAKNSKIQQQLMVADTNQKLAQNVLFMHSLPDEINSKHLAVAGEELRQKGEAQGQAIGAADFAAQHGGMSPDDFQKAIASPTPVAGQAGQAASPVAGFFTTKANQQLQAATKVLGDSDPYVQQLKAAISNPQATAKDLWTATNNVQSQLSNQEAATTATLKREEANTATRPKDLNDAVGRLTQAQQAYASNPTPANQKAVDDMKAARKEFLSADGSKAAIEESAKEGNPKSLAAGLVRGDVAWSQVVSSRKPEFAKAAFDAADALSMQQTGKHFSAVTNERNYKQATDPNVAKTLNLIDAMTEPKGSLDITRDAFLRIPNKLDEQTFNKIMNGSITELGGKSVTDFRAAVTGLAGEYSQIISGGAGTNESFNHAINIIKDSYGKGQGVSALDILNAEVSARKKGIVRDNPTLMAAYPDQPRTDSQKAADAATAPKAADFPRPSNVSSGAILMKAPGGQPHWVEPQNIAAARNVGGVEIK